jgi:hypothetical protein
MPPTDRAVTNERNWKAIAIVALLVAAGLAVAMYAGLSNPRANRQDDAIRALTRRLDALEPGIDRKAPVVLPGAPARDPFPTLPAIDTRPAEGEAAGLTPQQLARQQKQLLQTLEAGFAAQPADANAPRVEIEMLRAMNDRLLNGTGVVPRNPDVTCKRDACRITAQFRNDADATDWAVYYLSTVGADYVGTARQALVRNPDGSTQLKLYANRPR